jgi:hypothetical protein
VLREQRDNLMVVELRQTTLHATLQRGRDAPYVALIRRHEQASDRRWVLERRAACRRVRPTCDQPRDFWPEGIVFFRDEGGCHFWFV